jgi:hypothetical protein
MIAMTTNATPPAETAKDTLKAPVTSPAKDAPSTQLGSKLPSEKPAEKPLLGSDAKKTFGAAIPPVKAPEKPAEKVEEKVAERLTFHKGKFADYKLVRMYLLQKGCIQYDPAFPELVLNTSDKRGMILPLTPFFKSRIGVTLELAELDV